MTVQAKRLRLELLQIKGELERSLEDFSLICTACGLEPDLLLPYGVFAREFKGNLAAGIAHSHHEYSAFLKLGRIPIVRGVHLHEARSDLVGIRGDPRDLVCPHGDHSVLRLDPTIFRCHHEHFIVLGQAVHSDSGSNW